MATDSVVARQGQKDGDNKSSAASFRSLHRGEVIESMADGRVCVLLLVGVARPAHFRLMRMQLIGLRVLELAVATNRSMVVLMAWGLLNVLMSSSYRDTARWTRGRVLRLCGGSAGETH